MADKGKRARLKYFVQDLFSNSPPNKGKNALPLSISTPQIIHEDSISAERETAPVGVTPLLSTPNPPGTSTMLALQPAARDNNLQSTALTSEVQGANREDWDGLKLLAKTLNESVGVFRPLKQAADVLASCLDTLETVTDNRRDYQELQVQLDALSSDISRYLNAPTLSLAMTLSMENLMKDINRETNLIRQMQQGSLATRYLEAEQAAKEMSKCHQRIQGFFQRFSLNLNLHAAHEVGMENRLNRLPNSPAAYYRSASAASLRRGGCAKDTRVEFLKQLYGWTCGRTSQKIYWLNGMADTERTAIAYSLCERLEESQTLVASFFCSQQLPECRDVNRIVPTIAYQFSRFSRPFYQLVSLVLEGNPEVHNQSIRNQFKQLVTEPTNKLKDVLPMNLVVVIDALDKCDAETGVNDVLDVLLSYAHESPIKFFVTSRPDTIILDHLRSRQGEHGVTEMRFYELEHPIVQKDVNTSIENLVKSAAEEDTEASDRLAMLLGPKVENGDARALPGSSSDLEKHEMAAKIASSGMSLQEMFDCLLEHGCIDLSSHMNSEAESYAAISGGAFGDVYRGSLKDGTDVAIKALRYHLLSKDTAPKALKRAMRELYVWSKVKHKNIQELMGFTMFQGTRLGMVSLWMPNGNLEEYVRKNLDSNRWELCTQVAGGVSYLHSIDMVHGDLKARNVLVDKDGIVKISDFDHSILSGAGTTLAFTETTNLGGGTLRWMAPELLQSNTEGNETAPAMRSKQADVYALGMTMLEITTGKLPYDEYRIDAGVYGAIAKKQLPNRPKEFSALWMWDIFQRCWNHDPTARPLASSVYSWLFEYEPEDFLVGSHRKT